LSAAEVDAFRELVRQRGQRRPLQHLLGTVAFGDLELAVSPAALIPRPETEQLAQLAVAWLRTRNLPQPGVLDVGTGTGCLALAVAQGCSAARVQAVDISPAALELARANAARLGLAERVQFAESDLIAALPAEARFDLILSNPPYVASDEIATLEPEVRDHDPRLALDGGADGLDCYRRLAVEAATRLNAGGTMLLEFGAGQESALAEIFSGQKWIVEAPVQDYSGRARFLAVRRG
jgi:release factor glutamine methyltransferase